MSRSQGNHRAARSTRRSRAATPRAYASTEAYGVPSPYQPPGARPGWVPRPYPPYLTAPPPAAAPGSPQAAFVVGGRRAAAHRARRKRAAEGPAALRRLVPQALVVAFLAGGTFAFVTYDKSVRLTTDGVSRTLHTFADDVEELLEDEGVKVGPRDLLAPAPEERLDSGDEVVVRHGNPQDAPAAEQTYRTGKLCLQRGANPFPHCGRKLHQ